MTPPASNIAIVHRVRLHATALLLALPLLGGCAILRPAIYAPRTGHVPVTWIHGAPATVSVPTADAKRLEGYYWHGAPGDQDIFVFSHGRHFNADIAAKYAQHLLGRGDAVLVASYRGFGPNRGSPSEARMMEDATAFLREAHRLAGPQARLWLVGHSIGAGVALQAAAHDAQVKGVFALSGFARIAEATPRIARALLPDQWDNRAALQAVKAPVVFFQGGQDRYIPADSGRSLMAAATGPARLLFGAQGKHSPDMTLLGPWISAAAAAMASSAPDALPALPAGWIEEARRP